MQLRRDIVSNLRRSLLGLTVFLPHPDRHRYGCDGKSDGKTGKLYPISVYMRRTSTRLNIMIMMRDIGNSQARSREN